MGKTLIVGLTGQTGAGKTVVCGMLVERGYKVIDCDQVARKVVEKGKSCLLDLTIEFGTEILRPDGSLNRKRLGEIAFSDKEKQKRLGQITFPHIQAEIQEMAGKLRESGEEAVFLDAPTLLESGTDTFCDKVVSVTAPSEDRFLRIVRRDGLTAEEAGLRMGAQQNDAFYTSRSHFVIENGGEPWELRVKVMEMLAAIGVSLPAEGMR